MDARASNSAGPSPNTASVRHAGPVVGHRIVLVILAGTASWPGFAATNAIVADLITEERRESAYAAMRVAPTSALSPGPARWPLLIGTHWPRLFAAVALVGLASAAVALASLPRNRPSMGASPARLRSTPQGHFARSWATVPPFPTGVERSRDAAARALRRRGAG